MSFFGEIATQTFCLFFITILYIFWIHVLYQIYALKIFSTSLWFAIFYFLNEIFWRGNISNPGEIQFYDFCIAWFCVLGRKSLPNTKSRKFSSVFASRNFITITFESMIHFLAEFCILPDNPRESPLLILRSLDSVG